MRNVSSRDKHTVEEVLGQGVVRHELGDEQPLAALAAAPDQVGQAETPQQPNSPRLLLQPTETNRANQSINRMLRARGAASRTYDPIMAV
jgi:hypothetical protein